MSAHHHHCGVEGAGAERRCHGTCDDHFHGLLRSGIKITAVVEPIDCDVVLSIPTIVIIVIITSVIVIIRIIIRT